MFRFSIRSMLLAVLIVGMAIGWWLERRQRVFLESRYGSLKRLRDSEIGVLTEKVNALRQEYESVSLHFKSYLAQKDSEIASMKLKSQQPENWLTP